MTTTAVSIDIKEFLISGLRQSLSTYLSDLAAIPEDKLGLSPMGVARTPLDFTAECIGFNRVVSTTLRGDEPQGRSPEEREAFTKSINSLATAKQALEDSVNDLVATLSAMDEEALTREVTAPWGSTTTAYIFASWAVNHMGYHDGQLNYIQSLYGDGEMHWG